MQACPLSQHSEVKLLSLSPCSRQGCRWSWILETVTCRSRAQRHPQRGSDVDGKANVMVQESCKKKHTNVECFTFSPSESCSPRKDQHQAAPVLLHLGENVRGVLWRPCSAHSGCGGWALWAARQTGPLLCRFCLQPTELPCPQLLAWDQLARPCADLRLVTAASFPPSLAVLWSWSSSSGSPWWFWLRN